MLCALAMPKSRLATGDDRHLCRRDEDMTGGGKVAEIDLMTTDESLGGERRA